VQSHLKNFSEVKGVPLGALADLLPAAETIGNDQGIRFSFPYGG
jgi:hypothetical protein